jgi:hypothetical protein
MSDELVLNPDLAELHDMLVAKISDLSDAIGKASDGETVLKLVGEISEVNHRVTQLGSLLFTAQTARITKAMEKVRDAEARVTQVIKKLDDVTKFLKTISSFLALVDKVIDTAKLVVP